MPIQSALALVGAAKQTAKGSPGSNPTFSHGITDGAVMTVEVAQELESRTSGTRFAPAVNRTGIMPGMDFTCRAHASSVGLWLFGALGAAGVSGSAPNFTHAFSLGADLPYLTAFGKLENTIYKVSDFKVDSLEVSWSENEPVEVAVSGMGCAIDLAGTFTPGTSDEFATYMRPAGGSFQIDVDGSTLAAAKVTGGSVSINNSLAPVMLSGTLTPGDVFPGQQAVEVSLDVTPENLEDWRAILTGTPTGTTVSSTPVYGSFSIQFTDGTKTLTLASSRVAFTTEFPTADAAGGPITLSLAGLVVLGAAGETPFTATLTNGVASY
jgi:hypothetical protein